VVLCSTLGDATAGPGTASYHRGDERLGVVRVPRWDSMKRAVGLVLPVLCGVALSAAVAVAWIPVREQVPNTDLALIVVLLVTAMGATGHRSAVIATAVSGAIWFEFFDTRPFEQLTIARRPDVQTTFVLAVVGLVTGELAVRLVRLRRSRKTDALGIGSVRGTARLVAEGEDLVLVIHKVAKEITSLLHLRACTFESGSLPPGLPVVQRDGTLDPPHGHPAGLPTSPGGPIRNASAVLTKEAQNPASPAGTSTDWSHAALLPVEGDGQRLGVFVLQLSDGAPPKREDLLVAVTLADHVGAAFMAQAPPPPPPERAPQPHFRVIR
jgi:K+-sensing histidine kinase KdpD